MPLKKRFDLPHYVSCQPLLPIHLVASIGVDDTRWFRDHVHVQKHYQFQTSPSLKPLAIYVAPPCEGGTHDYINGLTHMTKMDDMPMYGKHL